MTGHKNVAPLIPTATDEEREAVCGWWGAREKEFERRPLFYFGGYYDIMSLGRGVVK